MRYILSMTDTEKAVLRIAMAPIVFAGAFLGAWIGRRAR